MRKIKIQKIIYTLSLFFLCLFFMETTIIRSVEAEDAASSSDTPSTDNEVNCATPGGGSSDEGDTAKQDKKVFCFFSLNNEKEFQYVNAEKRMRYQNEDTGKWEDESENKFNDRKRMLKEAKDNNNVEIVEYYGADNKDQSVEERFKQMMKDKACDSLVLSGHHAEYFTGKQSIDGKNWKLDLNFMEEMSCQPGCEEWFSNVKSLFLMGCNTVKGQLDTTTTKEDGKAEDTRCGADGNKANCKATYVTIKRATERNKTDKEKRAYLSYPIQDIFNQAYSATLDQNTNPLSSRYLKIFRNSSLYGWSKTAPGVGALSRFSIPRFIHMVTGLTEGSPRERNLDKPSGVDEPNIGAQDIVNFLDVMNNQVGINDCQDLQVVPFSRAFTATQWTKHWGSGTAPTSCYLRDDYTKEQYEDYKKNACDLNQALNEKPPLTETVKTAVDDILQSEGLNQLQLELATTNLTKKRREEIIEDIKRIKTGIKRNFNHLMNLVVQSKGKTPPDWHKEVKDTLQGSENLKNVITDILVSDPNIGFTKKADYLYFYKQVYGDLDDKEDEERHQEISNAFLNHLNRTYDQVFDSIDNTPESKDMDNVDKYLLAREYHALIRDGIVSNGDDKLADWLYAHQEKDEGNVNRFDTLIAKYKNPDLEKYLGDNVLSGDREFYSVLFNGFCYRLKESPPKICKETELVSISSVISILPILSK